MSEIMQPIDLSVVVPTHNRADFIEKLLVSIARASLGCKFSIEVLIIDDSEGDQKRRIEHLCKCFGALYLRGPASVREKRNIGIRHSNGKIILFVDSDCQVSERIFSEHMRMYNEPNVGGVLGVTEFIGEENYVWRILKRTKFLDICSFAKTLSKYVDSAPCIGANNFSAKKEVLEKVGGFDTSFPFLLGGDDVDLGIRINKAGFKIRMNPDAVIFHSRETWRSPVSILRRIIRWGRMDYYIYYRKHRENLSLNFINPTAFFFLFIFIGFLKAFVDNLVAVFLPIFWLVSFLLTKSILKIASLSKSQREIPLEMSAQFLDFLFNFGTAFESLKNGEITVFFKSPLSDPRQIILLWEEKVRETWSLIVSILITLLLLVTI
jgi:GT2 family glycosyltransferase